MKEFKEKLIDRLEEEKQRLRNLKNNCIALSDHEVIAIEEGAYNFCKNIVNKLAEEYINTSTDTSTDISSGWIACSERLPDIEGNTSDTVLVCTIDGFQHMAFWCDDEKWRYCESGMIKKPMEWTEIIAWMPLPAPYKKGE